MLADILTIIFIVVVILAGGVLLAFIIDLWKAIGG